MKYSRLGLFLVANTFAQQTYPGSNAAVQVPYEYTYLLPDGFIGNVNYTFVNGTTTSNSSINSLLKSASQAPFVSYDQEFSDLVGPNPDINLVQDRTASKDEFAYEAGVWVPERNEVWFASAVSQVGEGKKGTVYVFDMNTGAVNPLNGTLANGTAGTVQNPDGGYYFEGKVYFATYPSNTTYRGGIVSVDVQTHKIETVVNSYFGLPFNGVDDIVWVTNPKNKTQKYMFFTDLVYSQLAYGKTAASPQLPSSIYRWDPLSKILHPVVSRNELNPNGIRVSPDQKTLYIPDGSEVYGLLPEGTGVDSWLGPYLYKYELDDEMLPSNRRVFGQVRQGLADGIHVDDKGRVWTAESEGVVCRNPQGKVIGLANSQYFQTNKTASAVPIANFALAGDTLVVLANYKLWTVKLAETLVARNSSIVN